MGHQALSFIGATSAFSTSVVLPAHKAGDTILIWAARYSLGTITPPAGWTTVTSNSANTSADLLAFRTAESNAEVSGTWGSASFLCAAVWRNTAAKGVIPFRKVDGASSTVSLSLTYPETAFLARDGASRLIGFATYNNTTTDLASAVPEGCSSVVWNTGAGREAVAWVSDTPLVDSFLPSTHVLTGTAGNWRTRTVEMRPAGHRTVNVVL